MHVCLAPLNCLPSHSPHDIHLERQTHSPTPPCRQCFRHCRRQCSNLNWALQLSLLHEVKLGIILWHPLCEGGALAIGQSEMGCAVQVDSHLAELTVKETMDFSARAQGPGTKRGALPSHPRGALHPVAVQAALPLTESCKCYSQRRQQALLSCPCGLLWRSLPEVLNVWHRQDDIIALTESSCNFGVDEWSTQWAVAAVAAMVCLV